MSYFNVRLFAKSLSAVLALLAVLALPSATALAKSKPTRKTTRAGGTGGASASGSSSSSSTTRSSTTHSTSSYPGDSNHLGDRILRPGMRGHDVRVLQSYLTIVGYPTSVDGNYGSTTLRNVEAFQRANHFKANGVVTRTVELKLRSLVAAAQKASGGSASGGSVGKAHISHGLAVAPSNAPQVIKDVIAAANKIAFKPYIYGGGHGSWNDSGYDCSGSVSYALHGGGLISSPEDSSELESYGRPGRGRYITIWTNSGHVYMYVLGLRFDTAAQSSTGGSRWTSSSTDNSGFIERHPTGW